MRFHHIGIACADIDQEAQHYAALGYVSEGHSFTDPAQQVHGRFMVHSGCRIELLAPLGESSPVNSYLRRNIAMYHQAFEVDDLAQQIRRLTEQKARLWVEPVEAVAFEGRKICFLMLQNRLLIELIASKHDNA